MFVDFKAAYDDSIIRITRIRFYEAINERNFPKKLINPTKTTMQKVVSTVKIQQF